MKQITGVKQITLGVFLALSIALVSCGDKPAPQAENAEKPAAEKSASEKSAAEKKVARLDASDPNVVKISVPTIQCETCAKTITKGVQTIPEAQDVDVDVESKTVFVKVANNSPETQKQLEQAIAKAGYSTPTAERDPAAYAELPDCCKDGGME